jgi:hypothetical protein
MPILVTPNSLGTSYINSSFSDRRNCIQPCGNIGYRFLNKNSKMRELNFKYGAFPQNIPDKFVSVVDGKAKANS